MSPMEDDIRSTPEIARQTIARVDKWRDTTPTPQRFELPAAFLGCGSSYYVGVAMAWLYEVERGQPAQGIMASQYLPRPGWLHMAISRTGNWVARLGLGVRTRDATGGYRAFRRNALEGLRFDELRLRGYGFQIEVVYQVERLGLRITEIPITFVERASGTSKMSKDIVAEAMLHILRRRLRPLDVTPASEARPPSLAEK